MSKTQYDVLDVSSDVTSVVIKKAFYTKLQQIGGPEKSPEEYKKIREAYDTLYNQVSRVEYDSMLYHGDEINAIVDEVNELLKGKDPQQNKAIKLLKKAIVLGPKIGRLRNLLGRVFLETERSDLALDQFKKAVDIDSENAVYCLNLGRAYRDEKNAIEAERCFKKAIDLEPDDNVSYIALAYLYFNTERKKLAYQTLDDAILLDGVIDFADFMLFYHKIQMLLLENKTEKTKEVFENIYKIAKSPEDRTYAAWMFFKFAQDLLEYKAYELMIFLTEGAVKLDPNEQHYQRFHEFVETNVKAWVEFKALEQRNVHPVLIEFIRAYAANYGGHIDEDEYQSRMDKLREALMVIYGTYPERDKFLRDLKTIKTEFPECFDFNPEFFNNLLSMRNIGYSKFIGNCPYCSNKFNVTYGEYAIYNCPHCKNSVHYSYSNKYEKYKFSGGSSSASGSDCFVTTAIYGESHPNLVILRSWRDEYLKKQYLGRIFVNLYYKVGPYLAKKCQEEPYIKIIFTFLIDRLIVRLPKNNLKH